MMFKFQAVDVVKLKRKTDNHLFVVQRYKEVYTNFSDTKLLSWRSIFLVRGWTRDQCLFGVSATNLANLNARNWQREGEIIHKSKHTDTEYCRSVLRNPARWRKGYEMGNWQLIICKLLAANRWLTLFFFTALPSPYGIPQNWFAMVKQCCPWTIATILVFLRKV